MVIFEDILNIPFLFGQQKRLLHIKSNNLFYQFFYSVQVIYNV